MNHEEIELPEDPASAIRVLEEGSTTAPVVVFKKSPICPVSTMAEGNFQRWLSARGDDPLKVCVVDVISQRGLARGLTSELDIRHESPQALVFREGVLTWHDSHGGLTEDAFAAALG